MQRAYLEFPHSDVDGAIVTTSSLWGRVKSYLPAVAALLSVAVILALIWAPALSAADVECALALAGLMALAHLFPLQISNRTKISLDTSVIFAAVLLFEPSVAMLIAGGGCLLAQAVRRGPRRQGWIMTAQAMLQAAAGGAVLAIGGWDDGALRLDRFERIFLVSAAASAIYLVNLASVAGLVALRNRYGIRQTLHQVAAFCSVEDLAQFALGLLAAIVASVSVLALPLFILPGVVVYHSLQRQITIRRQTIEAVESLADIIDLRDPYTANHSRRVAEHARALATELGLAPAEIDLVERAARVHDIGKIVLDRGLLEKNGALDDGEWAQMRSHPGIGATILGRFPEFAMATEYVRFHHERVDGEGYPNAIPGEHIPLGARIIAVADALDAMIIDRPYRRGLRVEVALAEFSRKRGAQWDANVVDALLSATTNGRIVLPGMSQSRESTASLGGLALSPRPAL